MPEMFALCGKKFQVYKRAHKTCDTIFPVRGRRVDHSVHLETRCDGSAHGGCQASCLLFWKDAWLKPVGESSPRDTFRRACGSSLPQRVRNPMFGPARLTQARPAPDPMYVCQATRLPFATADLEWWDIRQYIEDYRSGNVSLWKNSLWCRLLSSITRSVKRASDWAVRCGGSTTGFIRCGVALHFHEDTEQYPTPRPRLPRRST